MREWKLKSLIDAFRGNICEPSQQPRKLTQKERQKCTFKFPFPQEFSIPSNILYYVVRNPAFPNGYLKLISTCKFLARMRKIFPVEILSHFSNDDINKWFANNKEFIHLKNQYFKLWIHEQLLISPSLLPNLASTLAKYTYKCSLQRMFVQNQILTFEELTIFVSGGNLEYVDFIQNVVKNEDGSVTEFEKVFELLCCKYVYISIHLDKHGIGKNTTRKIFEILSSDQIPREQNIQLYDIPEYFDFSLFSKFLKANMFGRQHSIYLDFDFKISDVYINQLQQFVNEIIQIRGIQAHTVPIIRFPGENDASLLELHRMQDGFIK